MNWQKELDEFMEDRMRKEWEIKTDEPKKKKDFTPFPKLDSFEMLDNLDNFLPQKKEESKMLKEVEEVLEKYGFAISDVEHVSTKIDPVKNIIEEVVVTFVGGCEATFVNIKIEGNK